MGGGGTGLNTLVCAHPSPPLPPSPPPPSTPHAATYRQHEPASRYRVHGACGAACVFMPQLAPCDDTRPQPPVLRRVAEAVIPRAVGLYLQHRGAGDRAEVVRSRRGSLLDILLVDRWFGGAH